MMDSGQLLRQAREAQELSLADVENQIRIRQRYLATLEAGEWDDLPNETVGRGFLRKYATFLGLDIETLLTAGRGAASPAPASTADADAPADAGAVYRPIDLDLYGTTVARPRLARRILGLLLALIPVLLLAYLLVRFGLPLLLDNQDGPGQSPPIVVTLPPAGAAPQTPVIILDGATPTAAATPAADATDPPAATATPIPAAATATPAPSATPTPSPMPVQQITLELRVDQRAWTRISADDQLVIEQLLSPGFAQTFSAGQRLELLTGNAGGIRVTVNGEVISDLGAVGEIAAYVWTLDAGAITRSTPTPEPTPETADLATPDAAVTPEVVETATITITPTPTATP